jgi:hypothetical protein
MSLRLACQESQMVTDDQADGKQASIADSVALGIAARAGWNQEPRRRRSGRIRVRFLQPPTQRPDLPLQRRLDRRGAAISMSPGSPDPGGPIMIRFPDAKVFEFQVIVRSPWGVHGLSSEGHHVWFLNPERFHGVVLERGLRRFGDRPPCISTTKDPWFYRRFQCRNRADIFQFRSADRNKLLRCLLQRF